MRKLLSLTSLIMGAVLIVAFIPSGTVEAQKDNCEGSAACIVGKVKRIVDGDTLVVDKYTVRLSLTNTPEKNEQGFKEARTFTSKMCKVGSTVTVDQDDLQKVDKYKRVLGKVMCSGKVLNAELLYNGHAKILTEYCSRSEFADESWAQEYGCKKTDSEQSQQQATSQTAPNRAPVANAGTSQIVKEGATVILNGRNSSDPDGNTLSYSWKQIAGPIVTLRGAGSASPYFTAPNINTQTTLTFELTASDDNLSDRATVSIIVNDIAAPAVPYVEEKKCDPSYPDVCIPPPPPDLDCGDIPYRNFRVLPPDPHRFDGDKDGLGCER